LEAETTSRRRVVRLLYHMTSILLYNVWQPANLLLAKKMGRPPAKPLLKVKTLTAWFRTLTQTRPEKPG